MIKVAIVSVVAFVLSLAALQVVNAQTTTPSSTTTVTPSPTTTVPQEAPKTGFGY